MRPSHSRKWSAVCRLPLSSLPLVLAGLLVTCHIDQLLNPSTTGRSKPGALLVTPATLRDSVPEGSTEPRHWVLTVRSPSASLSWRASVAGGSAWLELGRTEDTVPSDVDVFLNPGGLAPDVYRDEIVVTSTEPNGRQRRVPVTLLVQPPPPPPPPPSATQLAFLVPPSAAVEGAALTPPVQVAAEDDAGNTVPSFAGRITVAVGSNPSGGTLAGTRSVDAVNGIATFADLSIDRAGARYTLVASANGLRGGTSAAFDVLAAGGGTSATHLWYLEQPTGVDGGQPITPAIRVGAYDARANLVTDYTGAITISIDNNPSCGTLSGRATVSAVGGVATFSDLSIDKGGNAYTLVARAAGLLEMESQAFNVHVSGGVGCGTPERLWIRAQPLGAKVGEIITPTIKVAAYDNSGNVAGGFTGLITVTIGRNPSGGSLSGTTQVAAVNGVANFADLRIDKVGTAYTLIFTAAGLIDAETQAFNIAP